MQATLRLRSTTCGSLMSDTRDAAVNGRFPGQRLSGPKELLEGQVLHKRCCGNKLLFLELDRAQEASSSPPGEKGLEAAFSCEVYGTGVRDVRKQVAVGDTVSCMGTWRTCGTILDVFSYSIVRRWAEISGGTTFQAHDARKSSGLINCRADASRLVGGGIDGAKFVGNPSQAEPPSPEATTRRRTLCKFWMSNGTCRRTNCICYHPEGDELKEARVRWRQDQLERLASNAQPDDPHDEQEKKGHAARAAVFADWLCETFGEDMLRGGVMDIAGGRGELAFELSVKRNFPCLVLDPRCPGGDHPAPWNDWRVSRPLPKCFRSLTHLLLLSKPVTVACSPCS